MTVILLASVTHTNWINNHFLPLKYQPVSEVGCVPTSGLPPCNLHLCSLNLSARQGEKRGDSVEGQHNWWVKMSVYGMDEQLRIEQQKTDTGVVSSVNGWMKNGLPTEEKKPKYNKDGRLVLDEQEIVCEDGRMVLEKCLQDEVVEVEDLGHLLVKPATKVQKKKEEPVVKQKEEVKPKGGGMKIIIKGPFKVKHAAPSFIKEKKTVQEAPPVETIDLDLRRKLVWEVDGQPVEFEVPSGAEVSMSGSEFRPSGLLREGQDLVEEISGLYQAISGVTDGIMPQFEVKEVVEEAEEDSGVETTPTHQPKKHKLTLLSYVQEETLQWAIGSLRMPPYDIASWPRMDLDLHLATESVTKSEQAPQVSRAEEKVVRAPVEEVQGVAPNTAYSKPSYDTVRQDRCKALTDLVPSAQAVKLDTAEEKEVKTALDEVQGLVPNIVYSTPEEKVVRAPVEEVQGVAPNTTYSKPSYDTVRQDRYKALTDLVPSAQAVKLDTAEEKEVKMSLDEVQGLVPNIVYSTPCYHTVRQDRYKAFTHLVPSAEAPSIKLNKGKEQKAHLRLIMKGGDLAPINWHRAAVAAITQEYVRAKYGQVSSNHPIHIAKLQSAAFDLESIETHVDIAWNTQKPTSISHQYSKTKFSFMKSNSPVYIADTQTDETKLENWNVLSDLDWIKPDLIPVGTHFYKTKSRFAVSQDPLYSGIVESIITIPQSVDDLVSIQKEKANVVDVSHKYDKAKSSQVLSSKPFRIAELQSRDVVAESVDGKVEKLQYDKPEYEKMQQVVWNHNTNVVASTTAKQYLQGNQKSLHLAEDEADGIIEPVSARGCKFETIPQPYEEALKYEITPSQQPTYLQAKQNHLILTTEVTKENKGRVEYDKAAVELTGQKLFGHNTEVAKSKWRYYGVKEGEMKLKTEVAKENTEQVEFHKPTVELTKQELFQHDTAITESGQPAYNQAKKQDFILKTEVAKENTEQVEFHKPTVELTKQELFQHDTAITESGQPAYNQAKKNHLILTTEVAKENTEQVEFQNPTVELTKQELFQHDTAITESGQPAYNQAKKNHLILTTEVAKENTEQVEFQKPTVELTKQELFQHDTGITESGQPTYHEAKKNHLILTTEATKEITDRVEYDKAAVELTGQKLFRHNTSVTKSKWRYYGVREGRMTLQTEGVLGLDTPINYETATVRNVEQELHTANTEEVLVETADFFNRRPRRVAVPPIETLGVVEPLTYQAAIVHKVEQVYVKANQQEVTAEAPSYHEAEVKEVTGPKLQQGVTELDDLLYKAAGVEKVEAVYAKADQGEVTVEAPKFNTAITNSAFLTLSDTEDDVPEIKYDTGSLQATPTEPLHNVNVGEGKSECHLLHAEESEVDELKLEKTRKLKPPIIESAVREIVNQTEMTRPVFITNQTAVHAPLPTYTAKELNSLPAWETCQTFRVEEVTPLRAKPSIAVMNVCRAKASQPKVQLAEEVGIVQVDAVDCALSPPPKTRPGLFYLKPKEVQQPPLEEVGSIDQLNTESAKVNEIETPTLHKVKVTPVAQLKLELPKLEIREETETITVDDLDLSPVTVVSPTKKQIHAKIELEEPINVQSQMHVSLQALPRPLLKQGNEDVLDEVPLGSTLEIPEVAYHKARTSMCPLLTSHRAGTIKLPIQRAPPGFNKDWRTLKKLEGQRATLILNGETEAPYISRTSSVQSLSSQLSNDMWTYADDRKPTEKAEKIEPSPEASPEKLSSPPKLGSRKPLDDNTFKAPEETDAPAPIKEQPKAAPPKKGSAIQMVRDLLGLPTKGKPQPETKPPAPVVNETPPEPVIKKTPASVVKEAPEPVAKETPAPVVNKSPEPVVKETPPPVVKKAPEPVVKETSAPVVNKAPEPVIKETPAPVVNKALEPVVKEMPAPIVNKVPEPVVKETPAPVVNKAPEPVVKETPAPVVNEAPEPVVKEMPAPIVNKVPEPVVKETPAPVVNKAPEPVVKATPAPIVNEAPEPVVKETPAPVVNKALEPVVKEMPAPIVNKVPEPVVKETPAPVVNKAPEPVVKETPAPVVNEAPEPVVKEMPAPVVSKAPEPVVKETPAPVVSKAPEPIVIEAPPSKLPEPDSDVPTTPIPSSMVVPSGPPKSPPAASPPQGRLPSFPSSLLLLL
ncbi:MUC4 [Branchiostoma lanceolatum]|uniref:MUC4 protein n=1 Tax=Branchiostoma lanceolatum TaxID=7740 RepID=A0A8J9YNM1_BRALA|nr:MUC4 [Branchiostoma lanceolatum]